MCTMKVRKGASCQNINADRTCASRGSEASTVPCVPSPVSPRFYIQTLLCLHVLAAHARHAACQCQFSTRYTSRKGHVARAQSSSSMVLFLHADFPACVFAKKPERLLSSLLATSPSQWSSLLACSCGTVSWGRLICRISFGFSGELQFECYRQRI